MFKYEAVDETEKFQDSFLSDSVWNVWLLMLCTEHTRHQISSGHMSEFEAFLSWRLACMN